MITRFFGAMGLFVLLTSQICGQDWPQILGPQRNGVASNENLFDAWPEGELTLIWKKSVGQGYAGPVVKDDSVVVFHRVDDLQVCERVNANTGETVWKTEMPAAYEGGGIDSDLGPKAVPLIHQDHVILYDPSGQLICLDFSDGSKKWERSALKDYRGREGYFGAGSTPLAVGDKVIVNVGGRSAGLVAFDLESGKEVWTAVEDQASYSSPILSDDGSRVFAVTRFKAVCVNVEDGSVQFEVPFGKRGPTVNGAMPVLVEGGLFVNSAYQVGAKWIKKLESDKPTVVWENDETFSSQYSTPVFDQGHFFGTSGREDFKNGTFRCFEAETGKVSWSQEMPIGHTLLIGGKILHIDFQGRLRIIQANNEEYVEEYTTQLFDGPTRCIPAISGGRLFARSNAKGMEGELACFAIGPKGMPTKK